MGNSLFTLQYNTMHQFVIYLLQQEFMDKDNQQNPQTLIPPNNDDSTVMQKTLCLCTVIYAKA